MPTKCEDTHSSAFKYLWPIEAGHAGKLAIKVKTTDRQQFGNVGGGVVVRVAACRVEGYLWSWEVAMAGNWRQVAHFEEWLCALLACFPTSDPAFFLWLACTALDIPWEAGMRKG